MASTGAKKIFCAGDDCIIRQFENGNFNWKVATVLQAAGVSGIYVVRLHTSGTIIQVHKQDVHPLVETLHPKRKSTKDIFNKSKQLVVGGTVWALKTFQDSMIT